MKTTLILASLAMVTGCGFAARSPEMYRDDTAKVLETKNAELKACYDGVLKGQPGVGGKVTVKFDVAEDTGKIGNVVVDKASTTAPDAVSDCVKHSVEGLAITPPDANHGQGTFSWDFSQPPAPPAAGPMPMTSTAPKS